MFFAVEYNGQRKVVEAPKTATCTDVFAKAFGGDPWGDLRTRDMRTIDAATTRVALEKKLLSREIKSLMEDSGYTRAEAARIARLEMGIL